jgi:hypothetical protein
MTKLAQVYRVELGKPQELGGPSSREEALRRLEERSGSKARKMFERFLARIDKLECSEEEVGAQPIPDGGSGQVLKHHIDLISIFLSSNGRARRLHPARTILCRPIPNTGFSRRPRLVSHEPFCAAQFRTLVLVGGRGW